MRFVSFVCAVSLCVVAEAAKASEEGLAAWSRIYHVVSHPRCANCHTGASDRPMWSGTSYGRTRPHGMNVRAGDSRIGAETLPCRTCHVTSENTVDISAPRAAPQVQDVWRLAPPEADWFGRSTEFICAQLRDPERNGDRTVAELADHLEHDVILHWAWAPGGEREPAPYDLKSHINDLMVWGAAGQPCPQD